MRELYKNMAGNPQEAAIPVGAGVAVGFAAHHFGKVGVLAAVGVAVLAAVVVDMLTPDMVKAGRSMAAAVKNGVAPRAAAGRPKAGRSVSLDDLGGGPVA